MQHLSVWILVIIGSTMVLRASCTPATVMGEGDLPVLTSSMEMADDKPVRPRLFQSPEQIRNYLDTLGKYFHYNNRSRFGKRTIMIPMTKSRVTYRSKPSEEYDVGNIR